MTDLAFIAITLTCDFVIASNRNAENEVLTTDQASEEIIGDFLFERLERP